MPLGLIKARTPQSSRRVAALVLLVFFAVVLRHAWMMDDTYITLRVVSNLFDGHGLVWNPGERVQAFTHPLWLMLCCVIHVLTGEFFYSLLISSALISACALAIVAIRLTRSQLVGATLVLAATLSHAFVDYSTSGLENPLTHLLIALSAWTYLGQLPSAARLRRLCLLGGLALLCRPDNAVLLGPLVIAAAVQAWRRGAGARELLAAALLGGIPLWIWELFSLIYYGMLVPNTALAKLNTGIESGELVVQGLFYFVATLDADPLTLVIIGAGMLAPIVTRARRLLPLAIGVALHLLYVVEIGGDFMLGRQLVAPMFMALVCLSQLRRVRVPQLAFASVALALLGLAVEPNTLEISRENSPAQARTEWRITDERALLWKEASLVHGDRVTQMPERHEWWRIGLRGPTRGRRSAVARALGFRGFSAGPDYHWIDDVALTDPLLSRLPALYDPLWMHGHFLRHIPEGYRETVETGENRLADAKLRELYERLDLVTHGELWSRERFAAIWWLNTGGPDDLVSTESWRFYGASKLDAEDLAAARVPEGTSLESELVHPFSSTGAYVRFAGRQHPRELELSVNDDDRFEVRFYDGREEVGRVPVPRRLEWRQTQLLTRRIALPADLSERGFTRLRVLPRTRTRTKQKPTYGIGHLLFDDAIDATAWASKAPASKAPAPAKPGSRRKK